MTAAVFLHIQETYKGYGMTQKSNLLMAANLLATNGHLGMERIKSRALQRDQMHLEIKVFGVFFRSFCVLKTNVDYFSVKFLRKYFGLTFDYKVSLCVALRKEGKANYP